MSNHRGEKAAGRSCLNRAPHHAAAAPAGRGSQGPISSPPTPGLAVDSAPTPYLQRPRKSQPPGPATLWTRWSPSDPLLHLASPDPAWARLPRGLPPSSLCPHQPLDLRPSCDLCAVSIHRRSRSAMRRRSLRVVLDARRSRRPAKSSQLIRSGEFTERSPFFRFLPVWHPLRVSISRPSTRARLLRRCRPSGFGSLPKNARPGPRELGPSLFGCPHRAKPKKRRQSPCTT
jgi:hypothetical protein